MAVFYSTEQLPGFRKAVLTIGTFDGVHQGHRVILKEVAERARAIGGDSIVLTFEPHPRKLLFPTQSLRLITPLQEKLRLIADTGIEHIVVIPFTKEFSLLSAQSYIQHFLVRNFQPAQIIIGYDHHFGNDRTGNIQLLKEKESEFGYEVIEIPARIVDDAAISSTKIRNALLEGKVADAAHMLGRNYSLKGTVIEGARIGRKIGYPTANLQPSDFDQLIPAHGIYAVQVKWNNQLLDGMLSIGFNPTVSSEKKTHIEVHIFDFDKDIYGETIELVFAEWLRHEEKFDSLEALKLQLAKDQEAAMEVLRRKK